MTPDTRIALVQDNASHWYEIPYDLVERFKTELDKSIELEDYTKFEELYGQYRTGGDISGIPLYTVGNYDSELDTLKHKKRVAQILNWIACELIQVGNIHDDSKLLSPEKELFDTYTPALAGVTYNSPEYKEYLQKLKPALDHHYKHNEHHPEHYEHGVSGMDLISFIEMFADWIAASERHKDGRINNSITKNKERFNLSDQVVDIFRNSTYFQLASKQK